MRTIIYEGHVFGGEPVAYLEIGDTIFPPGRKVMVSDEWWVKYGKYFEGVPYWAHESLVSDVVDWDVAYLTDGAPLDITVIIPQFRTPDLVARAVESLRGRYPTLPLIIVDDGSQDGSTDVVRRLAGCDPNTEAIIFRHNRGHGEAVAAGMAAARTQRAFVMDSDVIVERGGFLEAMENRMIGEGLYAIGVYYHRDWSHDHYYLSCVAGLYDLDVYRTLPPFEHHGDPMERNMQAAKARGLKIECFPIFDYVRHLECGTRRKYGDRWDLTGVFGQRILIYGSTYITEVCVKALLQEGFDLVGHIPNTREPTVPGVVPLDVVSEGVPHDIKLSIQYDTLIPLTSEPGFNLHTGLLPAWGGKDILYHTIRKGARTQGLTFHLMTDRYDQGPIVSKLTYPVLPSDDMISLYQRMVTLAPGFAVSCMEIVDSLGLDNVLGCPTEAPTLYRRGDIALEDLDIYRATPARLRELLER